QGARLPGKRLRLLPYRIESARRSKKPQKRRSRRYSMRWSVILGLSPFLLQLATAAWAADGAQTQESKPRPGIVVWDTGRPSETDLKPAALAGKNEWSALSPDKTADSFKGDAVLSNGRIAAVLRKQDSVVTIHAVKADGAVAR